jgi:hypothetical protein|tara:strand:+ start:286 stop:804 length:519 start_codon:yes stop_codon:yes gene_type:complete
MNFDKKIISEIKQPYFFFKGTFDKIDSKYFIKKIDEGCELKDNNSFQTNVIGGMTSWDYFNNDVEFLKLIWQIFDVVDKDVDQYKYILRDAWGIKNGMSHYTKEHSHSGNFFSGVIYLNKHSQILEFPQINEEIKPEPGSFAIFSSFLRHGCKRHRKDSIKYGISFNCAHTT